MDQTVHLPHLEFALPLGNENRWSDMLAVLVATDPVPICSVLGIDADPAQVKVHREVSVDANSRPDLVLTDGVGRIAVIEVKVLSGLGHNQLERYERAEPGADTYALVFPGHLAIDTSGSPSWQALTWEQVISAYCSSGHPWARTTAEAWRRHLDEALPKLSDATVWNDLADGEDFVIAMRSRMCWLFSNVERAEGLTYDLIGSSAGVSWVLRMYLDAGLPGYQVMVEFEEGLPVRDYPKVAVAGRPPRGPSAKVVLLQYGVTTSAHFNWDYLLAMWPLMEAARTDWVRAPARPKGHDRDNHLAMVAKGAPRYLGIGFGEAQTKITGSCMFGARIQFPPTIALGDAKAAFEGLTDLVTAMAAEEPPPPEKDGHGPA